MVALPLGLPPLALLLNVLDEALVIDIFIVMSLSGSGRSCRPLMACPSLASSAKARSLSKSKRARSAFKAARIFSRYSSVTNSL
jgi:hypothetical protein